MHFVRRAAARAASSASTSQSRAINTSSPSFLLRSKIQTSSIFPSAFRQYHDSYSGGGERSPPRAYNNDRRGGRKHFTDHGDGGSRYGGRNDRAPRRAMNLTPNESIYVGNLLFEITAADLERVFSEYGTVKGAIVATDERQLSKGFGYVTFETVEQAQAAIQGKNDAELEGRRLIVNFQNISPRSQEGNAPSKTLFIGNLAFEMSDKDLNALFKDVENVVDVRVAIDRRTGQPRGFAHADFLDAESAQKAKDELQDKEVYGRKLRLDFSQSPRDSKPRDGEASESQGSE